MRAVWAGIAILLVLALTLGIEFIRRSVTSAIPETLAGTAVVFTGQFDRVEAGLALLERGQVSRLFISGVNAGAGIRADGFADQFSLSPALRDALAQGQIILASDANTTLENAIETACWLAQQGDIRSVVLVTHRFHMPRASIALERAVPWQTTVMPVFPEQVLPGTDRPFVLREVFKFAATWVVTILPGFFWPSDISADCGA